MSDTGNMHLGLTAADETSTTFLAWRTMMNGTGTDSNMRIIDRTMDCVEKALNRTTKTISANLFEGDQDYFFTTNSQRIYFSKPLPAGTYRVSAKCTNNTNTACRIEAYYGSLSNPIAAASVARSESGERHWSNITTTEQIDYVILYASNTVSASAGKTGIWSDIMITADSSWETYAPNIVSAVDHAARVCYVAPNGSDTNSGSDPEHPLATITKAVETGAKDICLASGNYTERLSLSNVHGLKIRGQYDANGNRPYFTKTSAYTWKFDNCTAEISDVYIVNGYDADGSIGRALYLTHSNITLNRCKFNIYPSTHCVGIVSSICIMNNCEIGANITGLEEGNRYAVYITNDTSGSAKSYVVLNDCNIIGNTALPYGIRAKDGSTVIIHGGTFSYLSYGVYVLGDSNLYLDGATFRNCGSSDYVVLAEASEPLMPEEEKQFYIKNCAFIGSLGYDVWATQYAKVYLMGCGTNNNNGLRVGSNAEIIYLNELKPVEGGGLTMLMSNAAIEEPVDPDTDTLVEATSDTEE